MDITACLFHGLTTGQICSDKGGAIFHLVNRQKPRESLGERYRAEKFTDLCGSAAAATDGILGVSDENKAGF